MPDRFSVAKIMETDVLTAPPETSAYEAARMMADRGAGSLVVVRNGRPVGIFTERDLLRSFVARKSNPMDIPIGDLMTKNPVSLTREHTLEDAHQLMLRGDFRHILVMDNGRVSGIFSIKDLARVREQLLEQRVRERTGQLISTREELARNLSLLQRDMDAASKFQRDLINRKHPSVKGVRFSHVYEQAASLGGDFFEVVRLDRSHIGVFMADVMGHGITSAMIAIEVKMKFDQLHLRYLRPGQVVTGMNRALIPIMPPGFFVAGFYGIVDLDSLEMSYTQFGLPKPILLLKSAGRVRTLPFGHVPLGIRDETVYGCQSVKLHHGEHLLLYTDGCVEQKNPSEKMFGEKRLIRTFKEIALAGGNRCVHKLYKEILFFAGDSPIGDDIAILLCEFE